MFSLLNILIACITVYSNAAATSSQPQVAGWDTELHDARKAIEYEELAYTGALTYDSDKRRIVKVNDSELEFFGPPSEQIDNAWQYLLHGSFLPKLPSCQLSLIDVPGEFPVMAEEEAAPFVPELQPFPKDHKYHFEYV